MTSEADGTMPFLLVFLTDGEAGRTKHKSGDTVWVGRGGNVQLRAPKDSELEVLRIDFRSSPRIRI